MAETLYLKRQQYSYVPFTSLPAFLCAMGR
jgi:hypothetical protein